ncbi:MAG TPA: hypothetical protein VGZ00_09020 [Candidatus Baltobacteraceae bacterium]|jgi:hypothetical protein|nr:hypothetical protein [Candidatus Baltobacteraceae bacterium]
MPHRILPLRLAFAALLVTLVLARPDAGTAAHLHAVLPPTTSSIVVSPVSPTVNQPVSITANVPNVLPNFLGSIPSIAIDYGDASPLSPTLPNGQSTTLTHTYTRVGIFTIRLLTPQILTAPPLATAVVNVSPPTPAAPPTAQTLTAAPSVPIGIIYNSIITVAPVVAGNDTSIVLTYDIATPPPPFTTTSAGLEAVVDLSDGTGRLIRRSDPFAIPYAIASGGVHTLTIPYSTPLDAAGVYVMRVYLRSANGGTVAVGPESTLMILPGPDPVPSVHDEFHANGSVEAGPINGGRNIILNPSFSTSFQRPNSSLSLDGLYDPVSRRVDPLFTLKSSNHQGSILSPDASLSRFPSASPGALGQVCSPTIRGRGALAVQAPAVTSASAGDDVPSKVLGALATTTSANIVALSSNAAAPCPPVSITRKPLEAKLFNYTDAFGRTQAAVPSLLGGSATLRGGDASYTFGDVTYHAAYGYTRLPTSTTGSQFGSIVDLTRKLPANGAVRLSVLNLRDDAMSYVPAFSGSRGPLNSTSSVLEYSQNLARHLTATMSSALSGANDLTQETGTIADSAEKARLDYSLGRTHLSTEYSNAGPNMAVAGGPTALSDQASISTSASFGLSPIAMLDLLWDRRDEHSVFARSSDGRIQYTITPQNLPSLTLALKRSGQMSSSQQQTNDQIDVAINKSTAKSIISFNSSLSAIRDALQPLTDTVSRSGQIQYVRSGLGGQSLGIGLAGSLSGGVLSSVTQSLSYSFPIAKKMDANLSGSSTNSRSLASDGMDNFLSALLSYHLSSHVVLSLDAKTVNHNDVIAENSTHVSSVNLRLGVQQ